MRLTGAIAALGAAVTVLSGCAAGHTAVTDVDPNSPGMVVAATSAATSLDFTTTGGAAIPAALMDNVYETLVTIDGDTLAPRLATSWEVSPDGTRYTFHLREGVHFSNGDEFDAASAAFSINYVKNSWTNGLKSAMEPVAGARGIGKRTLEVTLSRPSNAWLWSMATATGAMMSPQATNTLATAPVGTGPYTVAGFVPNEFISLAVRDDYWGDPAHQDVTIRYFPDAISSVNALSAGGVDVVWALQAPELLGNLPKKYGVEVGTTHGEVLLSMNNARAPFNDPRVRQAVAYGIDRDAANTVMWDGLATDTGAAPVPPTDPWASTRDYYPYDPAKARELMADAGAVGTELTITTPTLPYAQLASELLYSQLEDIGFRVRLESAEFPAVWLSQVMGAKDYQMSLISHVEPRDIPTLFGNPDYYLGYDSAKTRDILARADASPADLYPQLMRQAVDEIMADAGAVTLMNMPNIVLTQPGVTGVEADQVTDAMILRDIDRAAPAAPAAPAALDAAAAAPTPAKREVG